VFIGCKEQNLRKGYKKGDFAHHYKSEDKQESYFDNFSIEDKTYGTKTEVKIMGDKRIMITSSLSNHKTGEFPRKGNPNTISAQNRIYTFTVNPKYTGIPQWVREPGVALNGVKFEPGTAEVVECETGENYRVEAFQDIIDLGLDFNNAHVQPTGAYHYHGAPTSVIEGFDEGEDLVHVGFAHHGFPVYYKYAYSDASDSNSSVVAMSSSYQLKSGSRGGDGVTAPCGMHDGVYSNDYKYIFDLGTLDEANGRTGVTTEYPAGTYYYYYYYYYYVITDDFPSIPRFFKGTPSQDFKKGMEYERVLLCLNDFVLI